MDWLTQLEPYRNQAKTFGVATGIHENVYEIRFRAREEFERIWPTILQLKSKGAPLRLRSLEGPGSRTGGLYATDLPIARIYAPAYGGMTQKPEGKQLWVGPPWPESIKSPDGLLPEYVTISEDGTTWVPAAGNRPQAFFKYRARVEVELVVDANVIDLNRIRFPANTPIRDERRWAASQARGEWYVGPQGKPENPGTAEAPWDIGSALNGREEVGPGDTIWLSEGTYRRRPNELFDVRLAGSAEKPIHVQPVTGQRARIDGGLAVQSPSANVWIRDLEVFVSEPLPQKPVSAGSSPSDLKRPWGGLHMHGGKDCKYINLVIHHCSQGISCWTGEINPEIYGCILYDNGWLGVDRGHGHCIYTQNDQGVKTISNCIMTCRYDGSYTLHAYGSERAYVNNYLATENICYGTGPVLVGGGRPSHGIRVQRNFLYGVDMKIGYTAPYNEDCDIRDNTIVNGGLEITRYRNAVQENNLILAKNDARPAQVKAVLLPNKYDPSRAHLVIYNWGKAETVDVDAAGFATDGDAIELLDPKDPFGKPVATVTRRNGTIRVAIQGEFAVFLAKVVRQ